MILNWILKVLGSQKTSINKLVIILIIINE